MLAVANFSHLYCRNKHYYLRLTLNQKQLWISLNTDSIDLAVLLRSKVKSLLLSPSVFSEWGSRQLSRWIKALKQKLHTAYIEHIHTDLIKEFPPKQIPTKPPALPIINKPAFSQIANEYKSRCKASVKGLEAYDRYLDLWLQLVKDKPIDQYTPKEIGQAIDRCFLLPVANKTPYNKMTWKQRIDCKVEHENDLVSRKSVGEIYKWLKSIFAYACTDEIGYIEKNPCNIKRNFKPVTRGYFSDAEMVLMQEKVMNTDKPWHKWIMLIAMYHGMRRGEICQLRKEDIQKDSQTNRFYFFVRAIGENQNVKNANSVRKVPIHKKLLDLGFIAWIDGLEGNIFEGIEGYSVTSWFGRFMVNLGIESKDEYGNGRTLHSFRHSFITKVRNNYPNLHHVQEVVGHKLQQGKTTDRYTHRIKQMAYLIAVVDSFTFTRYQ